jgi:hypothetical protein
MMKNDLPKPRVRSKGPRYTPVTKRAEKPGAVAFLLKKHPELADVQIAKLVGSTKPTVDAIRNKTHASGAALKPVDPVSIGLCTADELDRAVKKAQRRQERLAKASAAPTPGASEQGGAAHGQAHDQDDDEDDAETPPDTSAALG